MTDTLQDIQFTDNGTIDIEAAAEERKPKIKTAPAYSGGKLDVAWTFNGERLPIVVDLETLEADSGIPFVLNHRLDQPLGTIENITKTTTDLAAEGSFTHGHTLYGANELTAARNGFKHRPSVTVYSPDPKNVARIAAGERLFINGREQDGEFFAVYHGKLRNIALVSTPGDSDSDKSGTILAQAQGVQTMSENISEKAPDATTVNPVAEPVSAAPAADITAQAAPAAATAPAAHIAPPESKPDYAGMITKMYERSDISSDIMAQAIDQHWSPKQAIDAQKAVNDVRVGTGGQPNVAGFPVAPTGKKNEPNGDMIMAAAFLMEHCGFEPSDFDKQACSQNKRDCVLKLDERTIDAATSSNMRGVRFSDICAHAVESHYNGVKSVKRFMNSRRHLDYYGAAVNAQQDIDGKIVFDSAEAITDIKADADTGLSTIGLKNIWALINTATINKAYQEVPTVWQMICQKKSVSNFLPHYVHNVEMVGDYQRLSQIGAEPPHASYVETQRVSKLDSWGLMMSLSRKDIINDEVGVFTDVAAQLGRKAAKALEKECFAALLQDGTQLFTTAHKNKRTGGTSAFGFDALDKAYELFRKQKSPGGEPIMVRPKLLLIPSTLAFTAKRLLSQITMNGNINDAATLWHNFPIVDSDFLCADNGLYTITGSQKTAVPGSDTAWYLFADPNDVPVIVAMFLNGKTKPTIEQANMRFSLDGIQYKATMDFEFTTSDFRGGVMSAGA